jgi:hypothetical protein
VERIICALLDLEGAITLECQYEMCEKAQPYNQTQIALEFELQARHGLKLALEAIAHDYSTRRDANGKLLTGAELIEQFVADTVHRVRR